MEIKFLDNHSYICFECGKNGSVYKISFNTFEMYGYVERRRRIQLCSKCLRMFAVTMDIYRKRDRIVKWLVIVFLLIAISLAGWGLYVLIMYGIL